MHLSFHWQRASVRLSWLEADFSRVQGGVAKSSPKAFLGPTAIEPAGSDGGPHRRNPIGESEAAKPVVADEVLVRSRTISPLNRWITVLKNYDGLPKREDLLQLFVNAQLLIKD
jgi:hypothetical protein